MEPSAACLATLRRHAEQEAEHQHRDEEELRASSQGVGKYAITSRSGGGHVEGSNAQLLGMDRLDVCVKKAAECDVVFQLLGIEDQYWKEERKEPLPLEVTGAKKEELAKTDAKSRSFKRKKSGLGRRASSMKRKGSMASNKSGVSSASEAEVVEELPIVKVDASKYLSQTEIANHKKIGLAKASEIAMAASFTASDAGVGGGGDSHTPDHGILALLHKREVETAITTQAARSFASHSWCCQKPAPGYPAPEEVSAVFEVKQLLLLVTKELFGITPPAMSPSRIRGANSLVLAQTSSTARIEKLQSVLRTLYTGAFAAQLDLILTAGSSSAGDIGSGGSPARRKDMLRRKLPPSSVFVALLDKIPPLYRVLESALQQRVTDAFCAAKGVTTEAGDDGSSSSRGLPVGFVKVEADLDLTVIHLLATVNQVLTWMRPVQAADGEEKKKE